MIFDPDGNEFPEAPALIETAMATISRVGENMSFNERKRLLSNLEETGNRIQLMWQGCDRIVWPPP